MTVPIVDLRNYDTDSMTAGKVTPFASHFYDPKGEFELKRYFDVKTAEEKRRI